eukprot:2830503-Pyramimonas_sp.AAC.1
MAFQEGSGTPRSGYSFSAFSMEAASRATTESMEEHLKRLASPEVGSLLALAPSDEITGELLCAQSELLSLLAANRERQGALLHNVMLAHAEDAADLQKKASEKREVSILDSRATCLASCYLSHGFGSHVPIPHDSSRACRQPALHPERASAAFRATCVRRIQ